MAKLIVLAHPFERLSGQVTREKQELVYNDNRNPLWNAPEGKQAALNFKPQMVVSYNSKTGKQSFRIQTKSIVDNTVTARLRMALFGGAQAIVTAVKRNPTLLTQAYEAYVPLKDHYKSFTSFLTIIIRTMLKNKSNALHLFGFNLNNPWVAGGTGTDVTISGDILVKFAPYLCNIVVTIDGKTIGGITGSLVAGGDHISWGNLVDETPFKPQFTDFGTRSYTTPDEEILQIMTYKGEDIYDANGETIGDSETLEAGTNDAYTVAPNA